MNRTKAEKRRTRLKKAKPVAVRCGMCRAAINKKGFCKTGCPDSLMRSLRWVTLGEKTWK